MCFNCKSKIISYSQKLCKYLQVSPLVAIWNIAMKDDLKHNLLLHSTTKHGQDKFKFIGSKMFSVLECIYDNIPFQSFRKLSRFKNCNGSFLGNMQTWNRVAKTVRFCCHPDLGIHILPNFSRIQMKYFL